jgi:hypothetical protein
MRLITECNPPELRAPQADPAGERQCRVVRASRVKRVVRATAVGH